VYRQFLSVFAAYVFGKHMLCGGCADIRCIFSLCRKGSKTGTSSRCAGCQGSGMKVSIRQLGPNMIQQMQHVCPDCRGSGQHSNLYLKKVRVFLYCGTKFRIRVPPPFF
jgi:DnaJ-class molecular chaperone